MIYKVINRNKMRYEGSDEFYECDTKNKQLFGLPHKVYRRRYHSTGFNETLWTSIAGYTLSRILCDTYLDEYNWSF